MTRPRRNRSATSRQSGTISEVRDCGTIRASAAATGRAYALCYDMTNFPTDRIYDVLVADWKRMVDERKITADERYLRHNGKPVLMVWGFFAVRFEQELANRVIDWRDVRDPEWAKVFRRFDVISPWNVGNAVPATGRRQASTAYWKDDLAEAKKARAWYMSVIYPGFGWTNLMGKGAAGPTIPRLGGEFFWRQFDKGAELGIDMAYVAMFDEVDEGTAILKISSQQRAAGAGALRHVRRFAYRLVPSTHWRRDEADAPAARPVA
jgi:hypothetical protein